LSHAVCCYNIFQAMKYTLSIGNDLSEHKYMPMVENHLQGLGHDLGYHGDRGSPN
jgi:hypothetical protein